MLYLFLGSALAHECSYNGRALGDYQLECAVYYDDTDNTHDREHDIKPQRDRLRAFLTVVYERLCADTVVLSIEVLYDVFDSVVALILRIDLGTHNVIFSICAEQVVKVIIRDNNVKALFRIPVEPSCTGGDTLYLEIGLFAVYCYRQLIAEFKAMILCSSVGDDTGLFVFILKAALCHTAVIALCALHPYIYYLVVLIINACDIDRACKV